MKVLILQYGDYGDAYRRFQTSGTETYRDQRHSVDFVASLIPNHEVITVGICERFHDEELVPGLRSIGILEEQFRDQSWLLPLIDRHRSDVFILRTPDICSLTWAVRHRIPTLPVFADFFGGGGLRDRLMRWRLRRVLQQCIRPCVANHSLSASESLSSLGLSPAEIVPWEFQQLQPIGEAKTRQVIDQPFRLFFAGMLIESKGVGDCIEAVAILRAAGHQVELTLAGRGDTRCWVERAQKFGVEEYVHLVGLIPSDQIPVQMRAHDAVLVPSRHDYAEGLPNTFFEALASRSPLIASDHPAFAKRLTHEKAVLQFRAAHPESLAEQIQRLIQDPDLYARLSQESPPALASLYVGIEWTKLIALFLEDPQNTQGWVQAYTLAAQMQ
jgi:glycosyltransferase involved in cell wall biosynthesis